MWEGLARTERQDRVLHGAAKLVNILLGIVLLPLWLFGQMVGGRVRDFLSSLERRSKRPLPIPPEGERTMDGLVRDLESIPQHLRHSDFAELRVGLADISNFVVAQHREGAVIGYRYPGQFEDHIVEGADGERIAATIALQEAARPARIFTSSRFDYVRSIAVRAFYEWGFNVAAIDLRSFGMTELTSPAPSTGGWKEGQDILALARYLKELGATSVGTLGISLGGGSVLNASDYPETATALDGGILAVSPPSIPKEAWARLSEPVPRSHPRYPIHRAMEAALISRVRSGRWPPEAEDMMGAMDVVSAPYYKLEAEQIWTNARGIDRVPNAKVPLLVLHPQDDPIIKADQSMRLAEAAKENDLVRVWILPTGSHGLLEAADPRWTHAVYRTYFERWATYAERTVGQPAGHAPELVYSSQEPG
jgi:pimeloyl-ACP methyl ester carboxylesterase